MTSAGTVTVDVSGRDVNLVALLERVDARMRETNQAGLQLSQTTGGTFTAAQQRAANAAIQEAQAMARAAVAVGDDARAHQILTSALGNSAAATDRSVAGLTAQIGRLQGGATIATQFTDSLKSGLLGIVGPAAVAGVALSALREIPALINLGAQAEQTRLKFDQMAATAQTTGDALLRSLQQASAGTIGDTNLQLIAMRANLLGVADSAAELGPLLAIARDRAQQMGISTQFALESLITGLGRGSALILDNIGLTVSVSEANKAYAQQIGKTVQQLTEAEQKQALINEVLRQGQATLAQTGGAAETTASKIERMNAGWENLKTTAGVALANVVAPAIDGANALTTLGAQVQAVSGQVTAGATNYTAYQAQLKQTNGEMLRLASTLSLFGPSFGALLPPVQQLTEAQFVYAQSLIAQGVASEDAVNRALQLSDAMAQAAALTGEDERAQLLLASGLRVATDATDADTAATEQNIAQKSLASIEAQTLTAQQQLLELAARQAGDGMIAGANAAAILAGQFNITEAEAGDLIVKLQQLAQLQNTLAFAKGAAAVGGGGGVGAFLASEADKAHEKVTGVFANLTTGARKYNNDTNRIHRDGGAARQSDQQKLNNQLLSDQERFANQSEQAELEHGRRLLEIDREYQKRQLEQAKANEISKREGELGFLKSITASELNATKEGRAEIARINEQFYADFAAAQAAAQAGNLKQSQELVEQARKRAQVEQEYAEQIAKARAEKNEEEVRRLEALREKERQLLDEQKKQILEGGDQNANERDAALTEEQRRYEEQQGKIADSADSAAERKVNAALRSGKAIDDENSKLRQQEELYNRIGSRGTPGAAGGASAAPGTPAEAQAGDDLAARLQAIVDALHTEGGRITGAVQDTTSAVRGIGPRLAGA